jgi:hypothetical protein
MRKLIAIMAATAGIAFVACDPYVGEPGGTPTVTSAFASIAGAPVDGTVPTAAGAVTIDAIPSDCIGGPGPPPYAALVFVKFNKLLDGASIQTAPDNCTPAAGALTTATPALAGGSYYICYNPSSPTPTEGASVVIFWAQTPAAGTVSGWDVADLLPADAAAVTTYHFAGSVKDKGGTAVAFDITANVDPNPNPGAPGAPTFVDGAAGSGDVTVNWAAATCSVATTQYILERAPNVPTGTPPVDAPGTFAAINGTPSTALTFTDVGTPGTIYWYRVKAQTATAVAGGNTADVKHTAP